MIGLGLGLKIDGGGTAPFSPANLPNLAFWVSGDSGFTVSTWTALAGPNVTQGTPANQGTASTLNGRASALFAATQFMTAASGGPASGTEAHTIFVAAAFTSISASFSGAIGWGGSNTGLGSSTIGTDNTLWWYGGSNSVITGAAATDNNRHCWIKTYDGSSNVVGYLDGATDATASGITMAMASAIAVANYLSTGSGGSTDTVNIGEMFVVRRVCTAAELAGGRAYLKARWGTP